ncbi:Cenp-O kinetochore centromere component-domain-containing protein [Lineolata rhizophorae]|uniref:Cenp-O kinetochore centromere component-domain-containing protein n=1 Tax=Lineolata rhizophorae TaxID=578093 RepID=A0A6A6NMV0_9PEZI|nr:Cenp-O kinetochore centromere component-domain-containing protein [Lineolata rhizophorae]
MAAAADQSRADGLDAEIARVRAQAESLRARRSLLASTVLSSPRTLARLRNAEKTSPSPEPKLTSAIKRASEHAKLHQENLHRICAGITAFRVQDPDPHAVDGGRVLGVRIEAFSDGHFLPPYYLLLHKPHPHLHSLRLHKHTIPPCIPLPALLSKHLPQPPPRRRRRRHDTARGTSPTGPDDGDADGDDADALPPPRQDLPALARALRRELCAHHLRIAAVARARRAAGLPPERTRVPGSAAEAEVRKGEEVADADEDAGRMRPVGKLDIVDVSAAHASAREVRIGWADGTEARVRVSREGKAVGAVALGPEADGDGEGRAERRRDIERAVLGGNGLVAEVVERLEGVFG